jgi:hypothetical protein
MPIISLQDPAVNFNGTKGSLFDLLEDMNAAPCIDKAKDIAAAQTAQNNGSVL